MRNIITQTVVHKLARDTLHVLKLRHAVVDVFLVSDARMRALNKKWRGKDIATNVLSFREPRYFPHPEFGDQMLDVRCQMSDVKYLGEIYLAPRFIIRHKHNIRLLVVHSILHLLGYTHDKKNDTMRMERKEKYILKRF